MSKEGIEEVGYTNKSVSEYESMCRTRWSWGDSKECACGCDYGHDLL